ncbi:oleoyl-acyl carrier protein thioesterase, chloroplastic-like isoform X4 [Rhododendron vialii]|uniref:oleoyl-acyl carrier protein thioesterase, chloroplastic-like isoform X4 n=1 Tax=Rhododendron vialii TaxID=182163 RepID=UPI00265FA3DD|nr:oleoyl-acyl carrier protein thioesterase, chloroplastic-like isoform X4 [Rhododendron vialii]
MLKLPSSSMSLSSSSSTSSCNAALIRKQCRSFGASSDSSSRLKVSIRRRNEAVSCEAADSSASSSAPLVAETKEKDAGGRVGKSAADRLRQGSLTEDGLSYKEKFIVRCYEVGVNKTATVETIANLLQEVACNHVQSLGFSTDGFGTTTTMRKLHLIWATARMHIEIYKYPAWLAFPEEKNGSLKKIAKLEDAAQYSRQGLVPRRADLDMNQHVNNVAYIGWFLESMPQEIIDNHELETITLDYRRECQQHDVVDSHTSPEPVEDTKVSELNESNGTAAAAAEGKEDYCQFLHLLRLSGDGLEINRGRTEWRKKPTRHANHSV